MLSNKAKEKKLQNAFCLKKKSPENKLNNHLSFSQKFTSILPPSLSLCSKSLSLEGLKCCCFCWKKKLFLSFSFYFFCFCFCFYFCFYFFIVVYTKQMQGKFIQKKFPYFCLNSVGKQQQQHQQNK